MHGVEVVRGSDQAGEVEGPAVGASDQGGGRRPGGRRLRPGRGGVRGVRPRARVGVEGKGPGPHGQGVHGQGWGLPTSQRSGWAAVGGGGPACGSSSPTPGGGSPRGGPPGAATGSLILARIFGGVDALNPGGHAVGLSRAPGGWLMAGDVCGCGVQGLWVWGDVCGCGHAWHRHRSWPGGVCKDCGCGVSDPDAARPPSADGDGLVAAAEGLLGLIRGAGGGQVPGPMREAIERLEAAVVAAQGVSRGTSPLGGEVLASGPFEVSDEAREALVVPTRACVALGGRRSSVCGRAVDDDAEGDLCPMHQQEATAIGRDVVSLLTRLRWSREG